MLGGQGLQCRKDKYRDIIFGEKEKQGSFYLKQFSSSSQPGAHFFILLYVGIYFTDAFVWF